MAGDFTDTSATGNLFSSLIGDAVKFATPFAQKVLGEQTTPAQMQQQRVTDSSLNGSGPNDPTLANQAPQGLLDFITGARVSGGQGTTSGLRSYGTSSTTWGLALVAIVAVFLIIRR